MFKCNVVLSCFLSGLYNFFYVKYGITQENLTFQSLQRWILLGGVIGTNIYEIFCLFLNKSLFIDDWMLFCWWV